MSSEGGSKFGIINLKKKRKLVQKEIDFPGNASKETDVTLQTHVGYSVNG